MKIYVWKDDGSLAFVSSSLTNTFRRCTTTTLTFLRMIIRNFEIIKLMTDIAKEDNLVFLFSSLTPDICYRDDSPHSSQSSSSSS
ncbi:hypothetical protein BDF14DRAFT_1762788 [Spinellus fusiger]|nr:hypothetical protein BDF14DRAFT_1762788 [Spinellus fusiger]